MTEMLLDRKTKWREIHRQQVRNNVRRWLTLLARDPDPGLFVNENYENILMSLESLLSHQEDIELSLTLMKTVSHSVFNFGDWERWSVYVSQALTYSALSHQTENQAFLFMQNGFIFYSRGEWEQAASYFQQAGHLYEKLNMPADVAIALGHYGLIQCQRGQHNEGLVLCQNALDTAHQAQAQDVIAKIQMILADVYQNIHEWEKALAAAQSAFSYYEQQRSDANRHNLLNLIITTSSKLGRWKEVAPLAHSYMDSLEQAGESRKLARTKTNLGVVFFEQGEYRTAEVFWYEALQIQSQIQEPRSQAILYNNLGHLYTQLQEWEVAETMLKDAAATYARLGDFYFQADTLDNLAECYQRQNKWAACRRSLEEAIFLLEQTDVSASYHQTLLNKLKTNLSQLPTIDLQVVSR